MSERFPHQRPASGQLPVDFIPPPAASRVAGVVESPGKPLDPTTLGHMERRFGSDFSQVRIHTDVAAASSAHALNAAAYTVGAHIVFARDAHQPGTAPGDKLLAHELAHVVQQGGDGSARGGDVRLAPESSTHEEAADQAADHVMRGATAPALARNAGPMLQRKVEVRDAGKGGKSGIARLPELVDRLNAMSGGLTYSMDGRNLRYETRDAAALSNFDRQMMRFIDQDTLIPMRLTSHAATFKDRASGTRSGVIVDSWTEGYVDIDDLLAGSDLVLQFLMVHFLRERTETKDYAGRVGTESLRTEEGTLEFERAHGLAIESEIELLRGYFGDPSIRLESGKKGDVQRVFRNDRLDLFRVLSGSQEGLDLTSIEVLVHGRVKKSPEEYLRLREQERREDSGAPTP